MGLRDDFVGVVHGAYTTGVGHKVLERTRQALRTKLIVFGAPPPHCWRRKEEFPATLRAHTGSVTMKAYTFCFQSRLLCIKGR